MTRTHRAIRLPCNFPRDLPTIFFMKYVPHVEAAMGSFRTIPGCDCTTFIRVSDVHALDTSMLEGETKARAGNCFSCHAIDHERVGPAYDEIAKRYAGQGDPIVAALVKKAKKAVPATGATCP